MALTFSKDGRLIWQLPAAAPGNDTTSHLAALRERLRAVQGGDQKLLAVDYSVELTEPAELDESESAAAPTTPWNLSVRSVIWGSYRSAPGFPVPRARTSICSSTGGPWKTAG